MTRRLLFIFLLGVASISDAAAQPCNVILGCPVVVDDFESGVLPPANGPFEFTHLGLPPQSCAGGSRRVWINEVESHTAGMVLLGGNDIGFQVHTEEPSPPGDVYSGADVILDYEMEKPLDLTAAGKNDRFTIDAPLVSLSLVHVQFNHFGGSVGKSIILQPGSNTVLFSEFPIALNEVTRIRLYFHSLGTGGQSDVTLSRIRCHGPSLKYLFLDLPTLVDQNPLPHPGPVIRSVLPGDDSGWVESFQMQLVAERAWALPGDPQSPVDIPVEIHSSDSGPGDEFGTMAGFEFVEGRGFKADHGDGYFQFTLGFEQNGPYLLSEILMSEQAEIVDHDAFLIPFELRQLSATGEDKGSLFYRLRVNVPEGVAYDISEARVEPANGIGDPDFEFSFEIHDDGTQWKSAGQPFFNISLEADHAPISQVTVAAPTRAASTIALRATPSIVSDRTMLQLSQPLNRAARLRIYDLAGRLVRDLDVARGQPMVRWDTTDARGIRVASGSYIALLSAGRRSATSRLVVVR